MSPLPAIAPRLEVVSAPAEVEDFSVFIRCHHYIFSVSTRYVERLLLPDEVSAADPSAPKGERAVAVVNGNHYAVWDLGLMMEMPALGSAWVLLRIPHRDDILPVALRTGKCIAVRPLRAPQKLPPGVFRSRQAALWGAFPAKEIQSDAIVGICLDPARLWTSIELDESAVAVNTATAVAQAQTQVTTFAQVKATSVQRDR